MREKIGSGKSILVVDDEAQMRNLMTSVLETLGFRVFTAASFEEAIEVASRERLDGAIIDVLLHGRSGIDVLEKLKEKQPEVPVIVVSGVEFGAVGKTMLEMGACAYLVKPFVLEELRETVRRYLA